MGKTPKTPEEAINAYSKLSEEELMSELIKTGACSSGQVSPKELDEFFSKVAPFLTPEQKSRMKELIMMLKLN